MYCLSRSNFECYSYHVLFNPQLIHMSQISHLIFISQKPRTGVCENRFPRLIRLASRRVFACTKGARDRVTQGPAVAEGRLPSDHACLRVFLLLFFSLSLSRSPLTFSISSSFACLFPLSLFLLLSLLSSSILIYFSLSFFPHFPFLFLFRISFFFLFSYLLLFSLQLA